MTFTDTLHELYSAMHPLEGMSDRLVPNLSGTALYDKRAPFGWGAFYNTLHTINETFRGDTTRKLLKAKALVLANTSSQACITEYMKLTDDFSTSLRKRCQNLPLQDAEYEQLRHRFDRGVQDYLPFYRLVEGTHKAVFTEFFATTCAIDKGEVLAQQPFWLWLKPREAQLVRQILSQINAFIERLKDAIYLLTGYQVPIDFLDEDVDEQLEDFQQGLTAPFHVAELLAEIDKYLPIVEFEKLTRRNWPIESLAKVTLNQHLDATDEETLLEWMTYIASLEDTQVITSWRPALRAFYKFLAALPISGDANLKTIGEIEWSLSSKYQGAVFFEKDDPEYMKCRDKMMRHFADDLVGTPKESKNNHLLFKIADRSHQLLCFANNFSALAIEQCRQRQLEGGFPSATIEEVDEDGLFAYIEKLDIPLAGRKWFSVDNLRDSDHQDIAIVVNQINHFFRHESMPFPLQASSHLFDRNGTLKRCHLAQDIVPINWFTVEKYLTDVSNGNEAVLKKLIAETRLNKREPIPYWWKLIEMSCRGENPLADRVAVQHAVGGEAIEYGVKLLGKLKRVREICMGAVHVDEQRINAEILKKCQALPSLARLPKKQELAESIIEIFSKSPLN